MPLRLVSASQRFRGGQSHALVTLECDLHEFEQLLAAVDSDHQAGDLSELLAHAKLAREARAAVDNQPAPAEPEPLPPAEDPEGDPEGDPEPESEEEPTGDHRPYLADEKLHLDR